MEIPSIDEFIRVAPIATVTVIILGIGYWAGKGKYDDTITVLKAWIESLLKEK